MAKTPRQIIKWEDWKRSVKSRTDADFFSQAELDVYMPLTDIALKLDIFKDRAAWNEAAMDIIAEGYVFTNEIDDRLTKKMGRRIELPLAEPIPPEILAAAGNLKEPLQRLHIWFKKWIPLETSREQYTVRGYQGNN